MCTCAVIIFLGRCGSGYSSPKHSTTWCLGTCRPLWANSWSSIMGLKQKGKGETHTNTVNKYLKTPNFHWLWQLFYEDGGNFTAKWHRKYHLVILRVGLQVVGGDSTLAPCWECAWLLRATLRGTYPAKAPAASPLSLTSISLTWPHPSIYWKCCSIVVSSSSYSTHWQNLYINLSKFNIFIHFLHNVRLQPFI